MTLHLISLIFLIKFSPPSQAVWRNYMLYIQGWLIALDIHMEILLQPVPLFPAPAGYTTGLLCRLGIPVQMGAGIGMLLICNTGVAIILCVLHRHQSILFRTSRFKLGKSVFAVVHIAMITAYSIPPTMFSVVIQDMNITDNLLEIDSRNLTWITQRGCYHYQKKELFEYIFLALMFVLVISTGTILASLFIHMNELLKSNSRRRSTQHTRNIRKSVMRLFVQLITPLAMMLMPAAVIFTALTTDGLVSFEQCLSLFAIMFLHPIAHNILLVFLTPNFRSKIFKWIHIRKLLNRNSEISVSQNLFNSNAALAGL